MLTERQLEIVFAVVYEYIKTGEPVGSRTISRKFLKSHSAATIRNEMSDLEEMGYFTQPHSSAGRLPTSMAYRVYVNSILHRPTVPPPEIEGWVHRLSDQLQSLDERLAEAASFLGRFTHCFSLAAVSLLEGQKLKKVDFIRLSSGVVLLVLVLANGSVQHERFRIGGDVRDSSLSRMAEIITAMTADHPWESVKESTRGFLRREFREEWNVLAPLWEHLDSMMTDDEMTLSTGGMREVFTAGNDGSGGREGGHVQAVSDLMDRKSDLEHFICDYTSSEGMKVTLGEENARPSMQGCAVMMTSSTHGGRKAVVGLVGPLRMNYENSIAVLEAVLNGLNHPAADTDREEH